MWGIALFVAVIALLVFPLTALGQAGNSSEPPTGNYCISCHTSGDDRLNAPLAWTGGIGHEVISSCPALSELREEVYQSERLVAAIRNGECGLGNGECGIFTPQSAIRNLQSKVLGVREGFARIEQEEVAGRQAPVNEIKVLRFRLGNNYYRLNQLRDLATRRWITGIAALVTVFFVVSLAWGYRNAQRFGRMSKRPSAAAGFPSATLRTVPTELPPGAVRDRPQQGGRRLRPGAVVVATGVFLLFTLPILRPASQPAATTSEAATARQEALDHARRVAQAAERASAQAWMMGRIGASWAALDPAQGEAALATALETLAELEAGGPAFWGEARAVEESAVGSEFGQARASRAAHRITVAASGAWAYRAIAAEWAAVDSTVAVALLNQAVAVAQANSLPYYRDLELRAIAVTWAGLDPEQGLVVAGMVDDPGLRAWALWEMGEYDQALTAARAVADPVGRARALGAVARYSGNPAVFAEALAAAAGISDATARAYALSDLAAAWAMVDPAGAAQATAQIDEAYPEARAYAFYKMAAFSEAWAAAGAIDGELERSKAQQAIVSAWVLVDAKAAQAAAARIADPMFRGAALRDVAAATHSLDTALTISVPYYQVEALTATGAYEEAFALAGDLRETYPLRGLAIAWAEVDPQAALTVVDELSQPADKAAALWAVARQDPAAADVIYDRMLELARATHRAGDPLAASMALFELAEALAPFDAERAANVYAEAFDIASLIPTRY